MMHVYPVGRIHVHLGEPAMLESFLLVLRLQTPHGPENFEGKEFGSKAECVEAMDRWISLIDSIDPQRFHLGYAACVRQEHL